MADYSAIEKERIEKNQQYGDQRAQGMRDNANTWLEGLNQAVDQYTKPVVEGMEKSREDVANQYRDIYDANAVQELVNRKQLQESMANMGLTDSGLNRTQQTALSLQHGNADAKARSQEQAARDAITQKLAEYLGQVAAKKTENASTILGQTNSEINNMLNQLYQNAVTSAGSLYNTQVGQESEAARLQEQIRQFNENKALQERELAQQAAYQEWQKQQQAAQQTAALKKAQENAARQLQSEKTSLIVQLMNNGYSANEASDAVNEYYRSGTLPTLARGSEVISPQYADIPANATISTAASGSQPNGVTSRRTATSNTSAPMGPVQSNITKFSLGDTRKDELAAVMQDFVRMMGNNPTGNGSGPFVKSSDPSKALDDYFDYLASKPGGSKSLNDHKVSKQEIALLKSELKRYYGIG